MSRQDTIEVDPNKLSQDVVDELVEQNIMDEEEAENTGDEIWLDEVTEKDPDKVSTLQYIVSWCKTTVKFGKLFKDKMIEVKDKMKNSIKNKISNLRNNQTVFAEVISVTPKQKSNEVCLKLSHNNIGKFKITMDPKSKEMSNLLEYKSVENPKSLESEKIMISNSHNTSFRDTQIVIPHNVSASGKIRFKLYSFNNELFEKTRFPSLYMDNFDHFAFAHGVIFVFSAFAFLTGESMLSGSILFTILGGLLMTPFILWSIVFSLTVTHFVYTILNLIFSMVLHSDYHTIKEE